MKPTHELIQRNSKIAWQKVEDRVVVVTPQTKKIHILSGIGGYLWDCLNEPKSFLELIEQVCSEYDVDYHQAEADMGSFIRDLEDREIILTKKFHNNKSAKID